MTSDPLAATRFRARLAAAGPPAVAALVAGVAALATALGVLLTASTTPSDGALVPLQRSAIGRHGVEVDGRGEGPLRAGDVITAVDGEPLRWGGAAASDGDRVELGVERDGAVRTVTVDVGPRPVAGPLGRDVGGAVLVPVLALIGALLLWRRPDLPATRALLLLGCLSCPAWLLLTVAPSPLDLAAGRWWTVLGGLAVLLVESALLHFVLVFPTPPPGRSHRRLVAAAYLAPLLLHAADAAVSAAGDPPLAALGGWTTPRLEPLMVLAILLVPIVRLRRTTDALARRQLRVVGLQLLGSGAVYGLVFALPPALGGDPILPTSLASVSFWPFPVVLAVAVLRFDLFELRLIAHRSLLYGTLTVAVVAAHAALVGLLAALTGERVGFAASAVAAGLIAVAAQPLRGRLQRVVDQVVYGRPAEPYEVLAELGRRLEDQAQPGAVLDTVVETVARSLDRSSVAIEVPDGGELSVAARCGPPTDDVVVVPLVHQRAEVGRLVVGLRHPGEELGPTEQRLLADLAGHVGTALAAARLALDVQRSRERLVVAREEERRRVGRDLHDGLGPRLAAAAMTLEAAGRIVDRDVDAALALHDDVRGELGEVIGDVRRLVYALRPPALDQLGLVGALREQAGRMAARSSTRSGDGAVDIAVAVDGRTPELPAAVEVAAYRIVGEALANAVRHAGAARVRVLIGVDAGGLVVEVVDDGRGMPEVVAGGVGLASMQERAEELGGTLDVGPGADGGTRVVARLPLERR